MCSEVADITGIVNSPISLLMLRLKDEINTLYECQSQVHVFIDKSLIKWMWSSSYGRLQAQI